MNYNINRLKSILEGKYEIVDLIASGGMGEIYLAIHKALGQKRAIKIIHQTLEKEKDIRKRFFQEAKVVSSIDHPGIIRILDFGTDEDFDYIIMPYIDGVSLQEKMETGEFRWDQNLKMMISMADAISYAHKKNIIHRDIKPANFMIDAQERIILTDFGISKNLGDVALTATNTFIGSPKFMSPEQITGKNVDKRSDLYSLGMVFYQMVTGKYAFESDDIAPLMYKQIHETPAHPSDVKNEVPREIGDIIMKLLAKEPDDRYPDGDLLLEDLRRWIHDNSELTTSVIKLEAKTKMHEEEATRIVSQLYQNMAGKKHDKTDGSISPEENKVKEPEKSIKKKTWFLLMVGVIAIAALCILFFVFQKDMKTASDTLMSTVIGKKEQVVPEEIKDIPPVSPPKPDIRLDQLSINESIDAGDSVSKTIHVYNDSMEILSLDNISTESDGFPEFLAVNKTSLNINPGSSGSFICAVSAADLSTGDVRTGRITIFSSDPEIKPKSIEVKLTVAGDVKEPEPMPDIRVEPVLINEFLEAGNFKTRTIRLLNDGQAIWTGSHITTGSDGFPDFLGPVNKMSFSIAVGESDNFTCGISAANLAPGDVRTGRINIYSTDPEVKPNSIKVTLTVTRATKTPVSEQPSSQPLVIRPRGIMAQEILKNIDFHKGSLSVTDVRRFLKLKIGYDQKGNIDQQAASKVITFFGKLPYARITNSGECDILITHKEDPLGEKLIINSNLYGCDDNCSEEFLIHKDKQPFDKIERIIKRNYCFNLFNTLHMMGAASKERMIDLDAAGEKKEIFALGEKVKFCMRPDFESYCMLLDVNVDGISKLFPIYQDQIDLLRNGETRCSININVLPPIGNEMIVVLGVSRKDLFPDASRQFNENNPIVQWGFDNAVRNYAIELSEEMFLNLIQESPKNWCVKRKFIRILGDD